MGYFAVSRVTGGTPSNITIRELHLNIWCLRTLGARRFTCDIGIRFHSDESCASLGLILPVEPEEAEDLYTEVCKQEVASLIFGEPVNEITTRDGAADLTLQDSSVLHLLKTDIKVHRSNPDNGDLWQCTLTFRDLAPTTSDDSYCRIRLHVGRVGSLWAWDKRPLPLRRGALLDLRISDLRNQDAAAMATAILPIDQVNVFLIAPWSFRPHASSPQTHYTRVLEGISWTAYLHRRAACRWRLFESKYLVYYWKSVKTPSGDPSSISVSTPFRVFLELGHGPGIGWADYLPPAVGAVGIYAVVHYWHVLTHPLLHLVFSVSAVVATIIGLNFGSILRAPTWYRAIARSRRHAERWILKIFS